MKFCRFSKKKRRQIGTGHRRRYCILKLPLKRSYGEIKLQRDCRLTLLISELDLSKDFILKTADKLASNFDCQKCYQKHKMWLIYDFAAIKRWPLLTFLYLCLFSLSWTFHSSLHLLHNLLWIRKTWTYLETNYVS